MRMGYVQALSLTFLHLQGLRVDGLGSQSIAILVVIFSYV